MGTGKVHGERKSTNYIMTGKVYMGTGSHGEGGAWRVLGSGDRECTSLYIGSMGTGRVQHIQGDTCDRESTCGKGKYIDTGRANGQWGGRSLLPDSGSVLTVTDIQHAFKLVS